MANSTAATRPVWTNWVGNQHFTPAATASPATEAEAVALISGALRRGQPVRTFGERHSFTPVVETSGLLVDLNALQGVLSADPLRHRARALAQTRIHAFGDALWQHGLALANQGDIDTQAIAGAIATGTHGSGIAHGSFSSTLAGARLIDGTGALRDISVDDDPETLHALQTSIGTLGIMTQVDLSVVPAYYLHEQNTVLHIEEILARWDELRTNYRHFSFFWMPSDESAALYLLKGAGRDYCMVKLYTEVPEGFEAPPGGGRVDRSYRIFPHSYDPNFHEMEIFMPEASGPDIVRELRELMLKSLPLSKYPMEVRFVAADEGWLSPNYRRANIVVSVSGEPGTDYWGYLRACDELFSRYDGRPHWGKLHFMTPDRMAASFPRYEDFRKLRRRFDPKGLFLNPHLSALFD